MVNEVLEIKEYHLTIEQLPEAGDYSVANHASVISAPKRPNCPLNGQWMLYAQIFYRESSGRTLRS